MCISVPCAPGHECWGTNSDEAPVWPDPVPLLLHTLCSGPAPACQVVKTIQTHGAHLQGGDAIPSPTGSGHESLENHTAQGPHYVCAPY